METPATKVCTRCKQPRPVARFHLRNKRGTTLRAWCKDCTAREMPRKKARTIFPGCSKASPVEQHLFYAYGLRLHQYDEMLQRQAGACGICRELPASGKKLFVDHDHSTGRIRGLLCDLCNRGIGMLKEREEVFLSAISYLKKWREI